MNRIWPTSVDIAVIGNGAIGLSIAAKLAARQPSKSVAVIGDPTRPGCATKAAGAMLGCYGEVTERTLDTALGRLRLMMSQEAARRWADWLPKLRGHQTPNDPLVIADRTRVFLNTMSGRLDDWTYAAIAEAAGTAARPIPTDEASFPLRPAATHRPLRALEIRGEGSIDSEQLLLALEKLTEHLTVRHLEGKVAELRREEGGKGHVVRIVTLGVPEGKLLRAETVIVAAGANTTDLIKDGYPKVHQHVPPIFPGIGHAIILRTDEADRAEHFAQEGVLRTPNRAFACGLHVVPRSGGKLYCGATNFVGPKVQLKPYLVDIQFIMGCVLNQIHRDLEGSTMVETLTGNRPVSLDTQPIIGATSCSGLYLCSGTYRDGVHLSPLFADVMADLVSGATLGPLEQKIVDNFRPERALYPWRRRDADDRPAQTPDTEGIVAYTVENLLADLAEAGVTLPANRWDDRLEGTLTETVRALVEKHGRPDWPLPPDFVPALFGQNIKMDEAISNALTEHRAPG